MLLFKCGLSYFVFVEGCTSIGYIRPTLDAGSKFLGTNLDSFEADSILELDPPLDPSLHIGSSNH